MYYALPLKSNEPQSTTSAVAMNRSPASFCPDAGTVSTFIDRYDATEVFGMLVSSRAAHW